MCVCVCEYYILNYLQNKIEFLSCLVSDGTGYNHMCETSHDGDDDSINSHHELLYFITLL